MESSRKKLIAGGLIFVGIIGLGAVVYNFIQLYTSMPSRSEVMDFAAEARNSFPDAVDTITGSLVPDAGTASDETAAADSPAADTSTPVADTSETDWLTPGQRQMLATLGIDEADLPATLTPELEACFVAKLGADRVEAIKSGETPTVVEGMKAATCL
jgi:hypothetical protein